MRARVTGRQLNRDWKVGVLHALYREDGTWYHLLERFPGALFDAHGYVVFKSKSALMSCPGILVGEAKNWVNFSAGIAGLPGYVKVLSST
jgi:5-methylcytosine-specific restriction enzyme A